MTWNVDDSAPSDTARIAALEATVADLSRRLEALEAGSGGSPYGAATQADEVDPWSVPPWPQVLEVLRRGKKIEAIKVYREHFGVGLKEAKDAIDEVERRMG